MKYKPIKDRIDKNIHISINGCWEWLGAKDGDGYGRIQMNKQSAKVSRVAWELYVGKIPNGLHVLHKCDNRICCNPDHLFLGNHADNMQDMWNKGRHNPPNHLKGENRVNNKLNFNDATIIRNRYKLENVSQERLAKEFGVSQGLISAVIRNVIWADME